MPATAAVTPAQMMGPWRSFQKTTPAAVVSSTEAEVWMGNTMVPGISSSAATRNASWTTLASPIAAPVASGPGVARLRRNGGVLAWNRRRMAKIASATGTDTRKAAMTKAGARSGVESSLNALEAVIPAPVKTTMKTTSGQYQRERGPRTAGPGADEQRDRDQHEQEPTDGGAGGSFAEQDDGSQGGNDDGQAQKYERDADAGAHEQQVDADHGAGVLDALDGAEDEGGGVEVQGAAKGRPDRGE